MDNQNNKITYTEALQMVNDKFDRMDVKLDRLDEKLDKLADRTTVLETKAEANKNWGLWLWGGVVTLLNLAFNFYSR